MKKFLTKFLIFCLILCVAVVTVNTIYLKKTKTKHDMISNASYEKFENVPYNIELCNFGSSHGANNYYYDNIQDKYTCFNFALPSQTLEYDYRILEYYKDHIREGAIIFITVSYMSLYGIDEALYDDFQSKNKRYYHFLPKEYIKEYDYKTDFFESYFPVLVQYDQLVPSLIEGDTSIEDWESTADEIELDRYVAEAYKRHLITNKIDDQGKRIVNEESVESLYDMIDLCRELHARPILITTPYLREYTDIIRENAPDFLEEFNRLVNKIAKKKNVPYYDYAFDNRFDDKYSLFMNADHLNKEGALKFVEILLQEIHY